MSRSRVLMFAYYFPPLGGGGVQRTLKHVKYLPEYGFDSVVIAGGRRSFALRDRTLSREVPSGTVVLRPPALPLQVAQNKLDGLLRRVGLPSRMVNEILWPDELVGWLPGALAAGLHAVRRHRPKVLYSTSLPMSAHVAALIVHRLTGLPWVADFRDPWALSATSGWGQPFHALPEASHRLERQIVCEASRVTVVDESVELAGLSAGDPRRVVIRNGVDEDDVRLPTGPRATSPDGRFTLAHVGSLYGARTAAQVFEALAGLLADGRIGRSELEVRVVGHASLGAFAPPVSVPITMTGYLDHHRAVAEMTAASALLFYQPPDCRGSSGKIFEYLCTGRPVLCVAEPDNVAYQLVDELGGGRCAPVGDPAAIRQAIESLIDSWRAGHEVVDPGVARATLERFSRRRAAEELAGVLRGAVGLPSAAPRKAPSRPASRRPPLRSSSTAASSAG